MFPSKYKKDHGSILSFSVIILLLPCTFGFHKKVKIGALFDGDEMIERAFEASVRAVNRNRITFEGTPELILMSKSHKVTEDILEVSEKACSLVKSGIAGIFGPQGKNAINYVQSVCDTKDMPCISARWYPEQMREKVLNLYPRAETLSRFSYDLLKELNWTSYAVLYQDIDSLIRMSHLMGTNTFHDNDVALHDLGKGPDFRDVLEEVRNDNHENIVLDCTTDIIADVLEQALQLDLITDNHKWFITSLDFQTIDLDPYTHSNATFVGIRLIDPSDLFVQQIFAENFYDWDLESPANLKVEAALMFDAVQLFVQGFLRLKESVQGSIRRLSCNESDSWEHGASLNNLMRSEEMFGITGNIKFNPEGFRTDFHLDIISLAPYGIKKIGIWHSDMGIKWMPDQYPGMVDNQILRDKHFIVLIAITEPFGMYAESSRTKSGNEQFEGFAIDIIYELSKMLGFNYTFKVQEDNAYGSYSQETKQWNGMIRRILDGEADLAITDLTINAERAEAVDFTAPFLNLGISVLYRIPTKDSPSMFAFTKPFSKDVWLALVGAYAGVSVILLLVGRMCPLEWHNPFPCIAKPATLYNKFTPADTPFFIIGSILKSNTGFEPKGVSTRAIATSWWFFSLLITTSYTANLAAFLSMQTIVWPFEHAEQLAAQDKIKYGAKKGGSTFNFFKNSTYPPYAHMYRYMDANMDDVMESSNENGLKRVMRDNYAFFMESTSIEYFTQRYCNVTQVGDLLDEKSYGIAMTKGAKYRNDLTTALLRLQENGIINKLRIRWWEKKRGGGKCAEKEQQKVEPLEMEDVYGMFVVLIGGCAVSTIFTFWEFLSNIYRTAKREKVSFTTELMTELKLLIRWKSVKPVSKRNC